MLIDRMPEQHLRSSVADAAPRSSNISRETSRVASGDRERLLGQRAITIWPTGLSGSGESSIAKETERRLYEAGRHVYVIDGDNLRFGLNRDLSFSKADRAENVRRAAEVARLFTRPGRSCWSRHLPFWDREKAGRVIGEDRFFEVHVATPLEVCEVRDKKGPLPQGAGR
jgi:adenylylsulfate kinase-like enzyme